MKRHPVVTVVLASLFATWASSVSGQTLVIRTDLAIDGHGDPIRNAVIQIRDDTIVSVESGSASPDGATVIDLGRYSVLPGMIDAHLHITRHFGSRGERDSMTALHAAENARSLLESGFTTARSLGSSGFIAVDLRDAIAHGVVPGPRLLVSGQGLTDTLAPGVDGDVVQRGDRPPADEATIRAFVRGQIAGGVDWIKIFATRSSRAGGTAVYSQEQLAWAVDEAERANVPVSAHAHSAEGARRAILAGARTIEHGALLDDDVIELMLERGTFYAPNLYLSEFYLANGDRFGFSDEALAWTRKLLPPRTEVFRNAVERGVKIIFSTDAVSGWISSGMTAVEQQRRVAAGQSPKDAIVSITTQAAAALRLSDRVGNLEAGMLADIIAVEGNPLEDIGALQRVVFVMKEGTIYKTPLQ